MRSYSILPYPNANIIPSEISENMYWRNTSMCWNNDIYWVIEIGIRTETHCWRFLLAQSTIACFKVMRQLYYVLDHTKGKRWDAWTDFEISLHKTIKLYRTTEWVGKLLITVLLILQYFMKQTLNTLDAYFVNDQHWKPEVCKGLKYYSRITHVISNYQKFSSCKK